MTFEPVSRYWIGHTLQISGMLIWGFAAWHVLESIGTSIAMLLNAASIVRIQVLLAVGFALPCLAIKAILAVKNLEEYLPMATFALYLSLSLLPIFFIRSRICRLIHSKPL